MNHREVKTLCNEVSKACREGRLTRQQAKTIIGQAKCGDLIAARQGLQKLVGR